MDNSATTANNIEISSMSSPPPFELGTVAKEKSKRSSLGHSLRQKTKSKDIFGQGFHMRLDGESIELNSWGGAICSLLLMLILSAYAI